METLGSSVQRYFVKRKASFKMECEFTVISERSCEEEVVLTRSTKKVKDSTGKPPVSS